MLLVCSIGVIHPVQAGALVRTISEGTTWPKVKVNSLAYPQGGLCLKGKALEVTGAGGQSANKWELQGGMYRECGPGR